MTSVPQVLTHVVMEEKTKETKVSFIRIMVLSLELLWLVKGMSQDKIMFIRKEIKPVAIVIVKLHLSEGIN